MTKLLLLLTTLLLIPLQMSMAATLDGVTLSDSVTINKKKLTLNGIGTRKATWFKVKVYVGGLYVQSKTTDAKKILSQAYPKFINMHFVRDVKKEKLIGGWNDAYDAALPKEQLKTLRPALDKFNNAMGDITEGEEVLLTFLQDEITMKFGKMAATTIKAKGIAHAILSVWFINPGDEGLRDGFLGIK